MPKIIQISSGILKIWAVKCSGICRRIYYTAAWCMRCSHNRSKSVAQRLAVMSDQLPCCGMSIPIGWRQSI